MTVLTPIGGKWAAIPVFNQLVPEEGPRSITLNMDFTLADIYEVDLQIEISEKIIWGVQGLYYDNYVNNAIVTLTTSVVDQSMRFQPRWQGYRPVLCNKPPKMTFACTGGAGIFAVKLLNVPMPFGEWNAA